MPASLAECSALVATVLRTRALVPHDTAPKAAVSTGVALDRTASLVGVAVSFVSFDFVVPAVPVAIELFPGLRLGLCDREFGFPIPRTFDQVWRCAGVTSGPSLLLHRPLHASLSRARPAVVATDLP